MAFSQWHIQWVHGSAANVKCSHPMKTWLDPQPISVPDDLRAAVSGHPLVADSLFRRGIQTPDSAQRFLDPAAYVPTSPNDLPDMDRAVDRVQRAIRAGETVLVWGDFDVDGQTATALLVSALRDLGANVTYHVPNRFREGHGIHVPTLKTLLDGGVDLLLTCDTGITAHDAVDFAQSRGVDVVITDHHALADTLPNAYAVVNPMRLPAGHALRELPGVGTAYKLVEALFGARSSDHLLDLVALGIVADVMVQVDDTRYLLQRGLDVLQAAERPGLKALMERAELIPAELSESDIGFSIGPRLNALGRLDDANPAVELLTTSDPAVIVERVNELEGLNQKRKYYTRQVYAAAQQQIIDNPALLDYAALVVSGEGWHTGVVGIVASRLVEDYGAPVLVLSENEGVSSGSARSVAGCDIIAAIRSQAHLLNTFGGHNMAAGLSLDTANVFEFRRGLSQVVRSALDQATVEPELKIDAYIGLDEINLAFVDDLNRLAPFGNGNPPLTLATRRVRVQSRRTLGRRGDHLDLRVVDANDNEQRVIWWFGSLDDVPTGVFDLAYTVRPNVFQGKREALVEWRGARVTETALTIDSSPAYEMIDYRDHVDPQLALTQIQNAYPDVLVWREGAATVDGVDRYHLRPARTLIAWTAPPTASDWDAALNTVQPETLILIGAEPGVKTLNELKTQVAGLGKYAFNHKDGIIGLDTLTARTAHTEATVRLMVQWLNANSEFQFNETDQDVFTVTRQTGESTEQDALTDKLQLHLRETASYRQFWRRMPVE